MEYPRNLDLDQHEHAMLAMMRAYQLGAACALKYPEYKDASKEYPIQRIHLVISVARWRNVHESIIKATFRMGHFNAKSNDTAKV